MPTDPRPLPAFECPLCGGPNGCAPAASGSFASGCWCKEVVFSKDALARVPEAARNKACLCRACATGHPDEAPAFVGVRSGTVD